jgi:hypothetical protein
MTVDRREGLGLALLGLVLALGGWDAFGPLGLLVGVIVPLAILAYAKRRDRA